MRYLGFFLIGIIGLSAVYLLILWISSLFVSGNKLYGSSQPYYRWLIHSICWVSLLFGHVKLNAEKTDPVPDGPVLYVCNHRSNYDPVILEWILRKKKNTFITKPENFRIFVVGKIARRNCCIPIDRSHPRNALQSINAASDLIRKEQFSVTVFPEGTRSRSGRILEFHNGVFKIAKIAEIPVVAYFLDGTERISGNMPWKKTVVTVTTADSISADEIKEMSTAQIGERIRNRYLELNREGLNDGE